MFKILLVSSLGIFASQANAQSCPDIFRFVDFGVQHADGQFSRGGPVFRGENLDFQPMLFRKKAVCRDVRDLAKDGRGHPVPVVTSITYDVAKTGTDLAGLRVLYSEDTRVAAAENAKLHHQRLDNAAQVRGENFLCVASNDTLSCQVVSPYTNTADLVIYCDFDHCRMPVLAVSNTVLISADWVMNTVDLSEPTRSGAAIAQRVRGIYEFFKPLTSGF